MSSTTLKFEESKNAFRTLKDLLSTGDLGPGKMFLWPPMDRLDANVYMVVNDSGSKLIDREPAKRSFPNSTAVYVVQLTVGGRFTWFEDHVPVRPLDVVISISDVDGTRKDAR